MSIYDTQTCAARYGGSCAQPISYASHQCGGCRYHGTTGNGSTTRPAPTRTPAAVAVPDPMTPAKFGKVDFVGFPGSQVLSWTPYEPELSHLEGLDPETRGYYNRAGVGGIEVVLDQSNRSDVRLLGQVVGSSGGGVWLDIGHGYRTHAQIRKAATDFARKNADHDNRAALYFQTANEVAWSTDAHHGHPLRKAAVNTYPGFDAAERRLANLYVNVDAHAGSFTELRDSVKSELAGWDDTEKAALIEGSADESLGIRSEDDIDNLMVAILAANS